MNTLTTVKVPRLILAVCIQHLTPLLFLSFAFFFGSTLRPLTFIAYADGASTSPIGSTTLPGGSTHLRDQGLRQSVLGPHHHREGELVMVGPEHFKPHRPASASQEGYASWFEAWTRGQELPTDWQDHYCLLAFGDMGAVTLSYR